MFHVCSFRFGTFTCQFQRFFVFVFFSLQFYVFSLFLDYFPFILLDFWPIPLFSLFFFFPCNFENFDVKFCDRCCFSCLLYCSSFVVAGDLLLHVILFAMLFVIVCVISFFMFRSCMILAKRK